MGHLMTKGIKLEDTANGGFWQARRPGSNINHASNYETIVAIEIPGVFQL
jgi:hypothetical protein